eukprot:CAMPEP_0114504018 /NCGR_PEP_ID=MMETSP0109-20121206/9974_1 /TAXON_ID=29199 /ORGANISM="Chlorarachnion reptans, Strain CCCM449" /LENGTH=471 /DNA_ID=CAMNT_0001682119 /DNA_START=152 /DNA_END=1563 /DNA_ORIENTATION=-
MGSDNGPRAYAHYTLAKWAAACICILVIFAFSADLSTRPPFPVSENAVDEGLSEARHLSDPRSSPKLEVPRTRAKGVALSLDERLFLKQNRDKGCPKVWIYSNISVSGARAEGTNEISREEMVWGRVYDDKNPRLRDTDQHNLGDIIMDRVRNSQRCKAETPHEADLFIIPMYSKDFSDLFVEDNAMPLKSWEFVPDDTKMEIEDLYNRTMNFDWRSLPYLTTETAKHHIILCPYLFSMLGFFVQNFRARRDILFELETNPFTRPLLQFLWATNTVHTTEFVVEGIDESLRNVVPGGGLRMYSFPFPSSVRTIQDADITSIEHRISIPWMDPPKAREFLMAFGGSIQGMEISKKLRRHIEKYCDRVGKPTCLHYAAKEGFDQVEETVKAKRRATFCLEPPGFGWERKSLVDSVNQGCIPVLFDRPSFENMWKYHWGKMKPWKFDSAVVINGVKLLQLSKENKNITLGTILG